MKRLLLALLCLLAASPSYAGWVWTRTNCGYVWRYYADPVKASTSTTTASTTNTDNSISYTYNINYEQPTAAQGTTLYGIASTYGTTDLGSIFHAASRLASDASAVTAQANAVALALGGDITRVAEIQAQGQAAAAALLATKPNPSSVVGRQYNVTNNSEARASAVGPPSAVDVSSVVTTKCISCHNPAKASGGLDLSDLSKVDARKVKARIVHHDPLKRMPLAEGGGPGVPLPLEEIDAFFEAAR